MADMSNLEDSKSTNDCKEDDSNVITMLDVLEEEKMLEDDALAVLGASDDKNCTYSQGYVKRQALYACMTCLPPEQGDCAGVCLACSYHCHEGHELIELYTKRNFCCDCGNSRFKGKKCNLEPAKNPVNESNVYSQNFFGVYCTCKRPYPDPDDTIQDEMIQCIVCEDWFHTRHLGSKVPAADEYSEMICNQCTSNLSFLQHYLGFSVTKISNSPAKGDTSIVDICDKEEKSSLDVSDITEDNNKSPQKLNGSCLDSECTSPQKRPPPNGISCESSPQKVTSSTAECKLKSLIPVAWSGGATYWPDGFRKLLCTCSSCQEMYKSKKVEFLVDPQDTVQEYEEAGKSRREKDGSSQYERGLQALSELDRIRQVEAIQQYNEMKTHLSEYLAKFAASKKVVREEDIREFFSGMQAKKKPKIELPYYCH